MHLAALDLRPGYLVRYDGRMCKVMWWNILRNDRRQFIQMKIKDIQSGRVSELKESPDAKYEVLENEEIELTHSYRDGPDEVFFTENGEEVRCPVAAAEDALLWPSEVYVGFFVQEQLLAVNPPKTSVLKVTETAPATRGGGNTGMKEAMLENGVKVKVNLLTEIGDRVRVDTETLEFKERITG
jgi:elongation factor P